ncbi:MAG TPA: hypothetical protein VE570_04850 [Thermoleophilaceae bacterium]|jgi:hypothetical protein|nr:hypothetical protein [Thermoleophilaceae bacterium]
MTERVERPIVIDALRAEFTRATEREAGRRRAPLRPVAIAFAALALAAATALAAGVLPLGSPLPGPPRGDVPARLLPRPGTVRLDPLRVPDPNGGPAWGVRIATSRDGSTCYAFGRVQQGRLGVLDAQGRFRPLPLAGTGSCGDLSVDPVAFDIRRVRTAAGQARTLVGGVAGPEVRRLVADRPLPARMLTPSRAGGFLIVYAGEVALSSMRLEALFRDGQTRVLLGGFAEPKKRGG